MTENDRECPERSDDMGRLIDADTLIKELWNKHNEVDKEVTNYADTDEVKDIICSIVSMDDGQPTAYDIDKVVEELQSEAERWEDSGNEYGDECEIAVARGLRNAIEIVKAGVKE